MVSVLAVNNYPTTDRFGRLKDCLEANGADVSTAGWREASTSLFNGYDGVVLSGSPDMLSTSEAKSKYKAEIEAIRETEAPLLGVCFGHQLVGVAFGSAVVRDAHVLGFVETEAVSKDPLFSGLPKPMMLLESRYEVVESVPAGFELIARSATSKVAAVKRRKSQLYGVQFHPERFTRKNPDGNTVVRNFVRMLS